MAYTAEQIAALETRLAAYLEAEIKILRRQRTRLPDGREVQYGDLAEVRRGIAELRSELGNATGAPMVRGRARRGVIVG